MAGFPGPSTTYTLTQAVQLAKEFDLVAAWRGSFTPYVSAMKAANPKLVIVAYLNSTFAPLNKYPLSWYARDANGQLIFARQFPNTYLLDVSNPQWARTVAQNCSQTRTASGYDGCFLDVLGPAPFNTAYVSGVPVNPTTHSLWMISDYLAATSHIAQTVAVSNPGIPIVGNGLIDGGAYFNPVGPTSLLLPQLTAGMSEAWIRSASMPASQYKPESAWLNDINMIVNAEASGHPVAVTVKVWSPATASQLGDLHVYALASFLLATSGHSYFSFLSASTPGAITFDYPLDHVNIGTPTGRYSQIGGAYQRVFTRGKVLVNPSPNPITVALGGTYKNLGGQQVTSLTLAPDTAGILSLA